jgi:1-phosphofructokinase family hexose kinase
MLPKARVRVYVRTMERIDILTITPNPSLDLLHETDNIVWDDANRVAAPRRRAGGQGINVARAVAALGGRPFVCAPLGGRTGDEIRAALEAEGIRFAASAAPGETRIFAAIRERATGRSVLINPRGEHWEETDVAYFREMVVDAIRTHQPHWVACCGSMPPGFPDDFYATLRGEATRAASRFTADCDGLALRQAVVAGCDLLVPNRFEAERLSGMAITDVASAVRAARGLVEAGTPVVIITLGSDGAVIVTAEAALHAVAPLIEDGSPVGAGDSLLAAVLLDLIRGEGAADAIRSGVAAGSAVLHARGTDLMDPSIYRTVRPLVKVSEV